MNVNTPAGAAILERSRVLMNDLKELKVTAPDDAQTIADQLLLYVRQQFGGARLPDLTPP